MNLRKLLVCGVLLSLLAQPLPVLANEFEITETSVTEVQPDSPLTDAEENEASLLPEDEVATPDPVPEVPDQSEEPIEPIPTEPETPEKVVPPVVPEKTPKPSVKPEPEVTQPVTPIVTVPSVTIEENHAQAQETAPIETTSAPAESVVLSGSMSFTKDQTTQQFINRLAKDARKIGQEKDIYASVMIAQAILESASGNSQLASEPNFNLFGIKGAYEGQSVAMPTQEDDGSGNLYTIDAAFRKYPSYKESMEDYADLMINGLSHNADFYKGTLKSNSSTYQEATAFLTGRYATDVTYNQKLNGLIETYRLTRYDQEITEDMVFSHPLPEGGSVSSHYGQRGNEFHRGLDLAANGGSPIAAIKAGTVTVSTFDPSWGNYVVIEHEDGLTSLYAHQSQRLVEVGDQLESGDILGRVGSTGDSTGDHLHLEIGTDNSLLKETLIDPLSVLDLP